MCLQYNYCFVDILCYGSCFDVHVFGNGDVNMVLTDILDSVSLQGSISLAGTNYTYYYGRYKHFVPCCDYAVVVTNGNDTYVFPVHNSDIHNSDIYNSDIHNRDKSDIEDIVRDYLNEVIKREKRAGC